MKRKIFILAVVAVAMLESCASNCGNKNWRTARFVEQAREMPAGQVVV